MQAAIQGKGPFCNWAGKTRILLCSHCRPNPPVASLYFPKKLGLNFQYPLANMSLRFRWYHALKVLFLWSFGHPRGLIEISQVLCYYFRAAARTQPIFLSWFQFLSTFPGYPEIFILAAPQWTDFDSEWNLALQNRVKTWTVSLVESTLSTGNLSAQGVSWA